MTVYSGLDVHICKVDLYVVKLLGIGVWIGAHICESLKVTHKSLHTFVNLSLGLWIICHIRCAE